MKLFKISIVLITVLCCSLLHSCIDSDYHWNNINTEGVIQIPPVPLGSYDPVKIKDLGFETIVIEGLPSITVKHSYTLRNIFGSDVVKDFFHPDMTHDLSIEGKLNIDILGMGNDSDGLKISIDFEVLDSNEKIIDKINIKGIAEEDLEQGEQDLSIVFSKDDWEWMENAQHLLIKINLRSQGTITLRNEDSLQLSNLVIKTGGYFVDL